MLMDGILDTFDGLFTAVNERVGNIAVQVGQTPDAWNPGIYSMIRTLSDTVILPIAGMILTFVMCYELIQMIIEKNNLAEFEVYNVYRWIFKTFVAVYILTHTFDIILMVFGMAQNVINGSAGIISGGLDVSAGMTQAELQTSLEGMEVGELLGLFLECQIVGVGMKIINVAIFLITMGRQIEIYLTVSIAPLPLSTMANREWGQMGQNYLKSLFAVAFQGFLMMVCVAIYAVLIQGIGAADNVHAAIWGTVGYTVLLCFSLFKTGSLAKSVFAAH